MLSSVGFGNLSVLSVEPYGMKHLHPFAALRKRASFSALGRAVWDETHFVNSRSLCHSGAFSALGRAVWDETSHPIPAMDPIPGFQCSRSSRMG